MIGLDMIGYERFDRYDEYGLIMISVTWLASFCVFMHMTWLTSENCFRPMSVITTCQHGSSDSVQYVQWLPANTARRIPSNMCNDCLPTRLVGFRPISSMTARQHGSSDSTDGQIKFANIVTPIDATHTYIPYCMSIYIPYCMSIYIPYCISIYTYIPHCMSIYIYTVLYVHIYTVLYFHIYIYTTLYVHIYIPYCMSIYIYIPYCMYSCQYSSVSCFNIHIQLCVLL